LTGFCKNVQPAGADSIKFLTLTIPPTGNLERDVRDIRAYFRRLRQRSYWRKHVRGGCYVIEIKYVDDHYFPHIHALIESSYMPVKKLSEQWGRCSTGRIVDIRRIPVFAVVKYVTKYITKPELSPEQQYVASRALKGYRLFQPFGTWHDMINAVKIPPARCPECGHEALCYDHHFTELRKVFGKHIVDIRAVSWHTMRE
jgi:hypothetical protein